MRGTWEESNWGKRVIRGERAGIGGERLGEKERGIGGERERENERETETETETERKKIGGERQEWGREENCPCALQPQ